MKRPDGVDNKTQIVIPRNRGQEVLQEVFDGITGGYLCGTKIVTNLKERFFFCELPEVYTGMVKKVCPKKRP